MTPEPSVDWGVTKAGKLISKTIGLVAFKLTILSIKFPSQKNLATLLNILKRNISISDSANYKFNVLSKFFSDKDLAE